MTTCDWKGCNEEALASQILQDEDGNTYDRIWCRKHIGQAIKTDKK